MLTFRQLPPIEAANPVNNFWRNCTISKQLKKQISLGNAWNSQKTKIFYSFTNLYNNRMKECRNIFVWAPTTCKQQLAKIGAQLQSFKILNICWKRATFMTLKTDWMWLKIQTSLTWQKQPQKHALGTGSLSIITWVLQKQQGVYTLVKLQPASLKDDKQGKAMRLRHVPRDEKPEIGKWLHLDIKSSTLRSLGIFITS